MVLENQKPQFNFIRKEVFVWERRGMRLTLIDTQDGPFVIIRRKQFTGQVLSSHDECAANLNQLLDVAIDSMNAVDLLENSP